MKKYELTPKKFNSNVLQNINDYFREKTARELLRDFLILFLLTLIFGTLISPSFFFSQSEHRAGTIAVEDIKADRDFLVEEKLSTEAKQSAMIKITPAIFDYNPDLSLSLQSQIIQLFAMISDEMSRTSTKKSKSLESAVTEKQSHFGIARKYLNTYFDIDMTDAEFSVFYRDKFSNLSARAICKLIDNIYFDNYIIGDILSKTDHERGIIVRNVKNQEEFLITNFHNIRDIRVTKDGLIAKGEDLLSHQSKDFRWAAASLIKKIIMPNLILNIKATDAKRDAALETIKPSYFQVLKNEMIVREGEKITRSIQDKLDAYYAIKGGKSKMKDVAAFVGVALIVLLMGIACISPIRKWNPKSHDLKTTIVFLATLVLLQFILIRFGLIISDAVARAFPGLDAQDCFYAIPYVMGSMLVTVLINDRIAVIYSVFVSLLLGFIFDAKVLMPIFSLAGSIFVIYQIYFTRQRSAFFMAGFLLGFVNCIIIFAIALIAETFLDWILLIKLFMGFIGGLAAGIIAAGLLPLCESLFKFTTDIRLLELGNLNQPIFQRMIIETPGTYHHSIIVASLAESAAEAIGANALLAKVSAYYHDVGKLVKPHYFIENQPVGENKHDKLSPKMSSLVIISHVKDGCDFAQQLKLGNRIINIIRQHHGTSLVTFFYDKAKKDPDSTFNSLSDSDFRYPGPKPQTKEAGLVMLSDVIEASSRTLDDPTPSRISNLVHERIERVFLDGQLDECELTLKDLHKIAGSFIRILTGIFHHRVNYPEQINTKDNIGLKEA